MDKSMAYGFFSLHAFCCVMFYFTVRHKSKFQVWSECLMVGLIPVFGLLFMGVMKLADFLRSEATEDPDVYHQFSNDQMVMGGGLQTEVNIIPLNDALFIEELKEKRALLTNAIKQNILENDKILQRALKDADREVSHYAVSMLTNQIENLEAELSEIERQMAEEGETPLLLCAYAGKTKMYLNINFLDKISQRNAEERYVALLYKLLAANIRERPVYEDIIDYEIKFSHYQETEILCGAFAAGFPNQEEPYLAYIKLYSEMKDFAKQQQMIGALKASPIQLTARALEILRFWDRGERHV